MKEIEINTQNGFIKFIKYNKLKIKSLGFYAEGEVKLNSEILNDFFQKIENCFLLKDNFEIIYLVSMNKLLLIEVRCSSKDKKIYLIGEYRANKDDGNMLEFEFLVSQNNIMDAIEQFKKM